MIGKYIPSEIENKWRERWEEKRIYSPDLDRAKKPFYNLMMFPYPSAEGMHVGNMYAFTGSDIYGRFKRMQGFDVFEPMGLDGFGIHSENYAIKVGRHPKEQVKISEANFYRQLRATGNGFDWSRKLETYDPNYYKWTQWIFIQLFKAGLAYRRKAPVNFCPSCKTVLADEQVIDGKCERCSSVVEKKELDQWFFRITNYAERLLSNLENLDWTEKVKIAQRNWIGKKEGIIIKYKIVSSSPRRQAGKYKIECWTSRPDTNFGATLIVLAPEHPLCLKISTKGNIQKVKEYIKISQNKSEKERIAEGREKTGIFTGSYAVNMLTGERMPIWVSDFVLMEFGTGAVVGVPGHDKRDFEFAQKFGLPIKRVVVGKDGDTSIITRIEQVQEGEGIIINSEFLNGLDTHRATQKIMNYLEEKGWGKRVVTYHLRDWLISRQRYWGPPIPMVFCEACASKGKSWFAVQKTQKTQRASSSMNQNTRRSDLSDNPILRKSDAPSFSEFSENMYGWFPVPEDQLPVLLPQVEDWRPKGTGQSPLANHPEFYKTTCPKCGGEARRETDVSDTFLDSSWYFFRYLATERNDVPFPSEALINSKFEARNPKWFDKLIILSGVEGQSQNSNVQNSKQFRISDFDIRAFAQRARWLPVDMYIGGAEHSVLHLLYSRFITMVFRDIGFISFEEPFRTFRAHGLLISQGAKMSKSKGNVVVPDEYIKKYGADTLRSYLMFIGPFSQGGDFQDAGIEGMYRFLRRVWTLVLSLVLACPAGAEVGNNPPLADVASPRSFLNASPAADFPHSLRMMHKTIKKVTEDIEHLRYNTAIAALMEYYNKISNLLPRRLASRSGQAGKSQISNTEMREHAKTLVLLMAPFAPHMTEELWQRCSAEVGNKNFLVHDAKKGKVSSRIAKPASAHSENFVASPRFLSIHLQPWPSYDPKMLREEEATIVVQVNGRVRETIKIKNKKLKMKNDIEKIARESNKVKKFLEGKDVEKIIYVEGKIINFVTE